MLEFAFMQRALVASVLIGLACGFLGFFVILRRLAFVGVGISHSAIGGVALGLLLGINPLITAAVFAVAVALGIAWGSRLGDVSEDALIGVYFSGSMALGVVLFSLNRGYQQDIFGYLFGNVLAVSAGELAALAIATVVILSVLAWFFRAFLFMSFDEEVARAYGQPVDALNSGLLVLLAVTVIVGVRLVGILLVEALLVIPAATAAMWTRHFRGQLALSAALATACGVTGLLASAWLDIAAGGAIVLVAVVLFFVSLAFRRIAI